MSEGPRTSRYERICALASALAHEVKNPLSTTAMTLQLLREELAQNAGEGVAASLRRVDAMAVELARIERIVGDFLRLSRDPDLNFRPLDLNTLVEDAVGSLRLELERGSVATMLQLDRRLSAIPLDEAWFRQALMGLLRNAIQAMASGGTLTAQTTLQGDVVEISVIDTGPGIEPGLVTKVFEAFFTTKPGAPGIGLSMARQIVELHRGTIACESAVGCGTRMLIQLPLDPSGGTKS